MNGDIHDDTLSSVVLMSETSETLGACSHQLRPKPAEIKTKAPFQTREKILSGVITEVLLAFISLFLKRGQKKKIRYFSIILLLEKMLFQTPNFLRALQNPQRILLSILMLLNRR